MIKPGDRIRVITWGWRKATVISTQPLIVQFDGERKPLKLNANDSYELFPELTS